MSGVRCGTAVYGGYRTRTLQVSGRGPLIVLLHGFGDSADTWAGVLTRFADAGRSALAVDLPGFGEADALADGPTLPQHDRFVDSLVGTHSRQGPVLLVGNSLGALAAVRAAGRCAPVAGVVTMAEPSYGDSWLIRRFMRDRPSILVRLLTLNPALPEQAQRWMIGVAVRLALCAHPRHADPGVGLRLAEFVLARGGPGRVVREAWRLGRETLEGTDLSAIECPLLAVHGRRDRIIPVNAARALKAGVPHAELRIEADWGHCPQLDDPVGVARLVLEFADGLAVPDELTY